MKNSFKKTHLLYFQGRIQLSLVTNNETGCGKCCQVSQLASCSWTPKSCSIWGCVHPCNFHVWYHTGTRCCVVLIIIDKSVCGCVGACVFSASQLLVLLLACFSVSELVCFNYGLVLCSLLCVFVFLTMSWFSVLCFVMSYMCINLEK